MMPKHLPGPFAWHGVTLGEDRWRHSLSSSDLAELDAALGQAVVRGLEATEIGPRDFPLPRLSAKLAAMGTELEDGCGMIVLRGLPVDG